jgi:hypothetical protein
VAGFRGGVEPKNAGYAALANAAFFDAKASGLFRASLDRALESCRRRTDSSAQDARGPMTMSLPRAGTLESRMLFRKEVLDIE